MQIMRPHAAESSLTTLSRQHSLRFAQDRPFETEVSQRDSLTMPKTHVASCDGVVSVTFACISYSESIYGC